MVSNALEVVGLLLIAAAVAVLFGWRWGLLALGIELATLGYAIDNGSTGKPDNP